jgi:hypothetical protein
VILPAVDELGISALARVTVADLDHALTRIAPRRRKRLSLTEIFALSLSHQIV